MLDRRRMLELICTSVPIFGMVGCGGGGSQAPKTVEVTDEMKRQAEASDAYISEQSKQKKSPAK